MRINRLFQIMKQFRRETKGAVFVEYLMLLTIVGIGAIAGLATVRGALIGELFDLAEAISAISP